MQTTEFSLYKVLSAISTLGIGLVDEVDDGYSISRQTGTISGEPDGYSCIVSLSVSTLSIITFDKEGNRKEYDFTAPTDIYDFTGNLSKVGLLEDSDDVQMIIDVYNDNFNNPGWLNVPDSGKILDNYSQNLTLSPSNSSPYSIYLC